MAIKNEYLKKVFAQVQSRDKNEPEFLQAVEDEKIPEGMTAKEFAMQRARKALPALLKGHKGDIIAILASIEGVSAENYKGALNLVKLMRDATDLLSDDAFTALFISAQSENSSGSARENTEGQKV